MINLLSNFLSYITAPLYTLISTPTWFFRAPGKFMGMSIPWRVAIFIGICLTIMISTLVVMQLWGLFGAEHQFPAQNNAVTFTLLMLFLVVATSVVSGLATHFWLMDIPSRYPEIDRAWNEGVSELRSFGIELTDYPLFLVLGIVDQASCLALMKASKMTLGVQPKSDRSKPLYWFSAEKDGETSIFLFLSTCCQTSLLSGGRGMKEDVAEVKGPAKGGKPQGSPYETINSSDGDGDSAVNSIGAMHSFGAGSDIDPLSSAEEFDSDMGGPRHSLADFDDAPARGGGRSPMQTINSDDEDDRGAVAVAAPSTTRGIQSLNAKMADQAGEELRYVCRRLRAAREPFCPFNSAIVSVPFPMLKSAGDKQGSNLGKATRSDLTVLTTESGLRSHVISMIHGMENDDDFRVFINRMREFDSPAEVDRRIGKGLSAWSVLNTETIMDVGSCACDAFQKLIYKYFSITNSLKKVNNGQLYRFLAKIRGPVGNNLNTWLVEGFAPSQDQDGRPTNATEWPQLAGCYFVAAQPTSIDDKSEEGLYAHVPGVFGRLNELEGEIEWTPATLRGDKAHRDIARSLSVVILIGILAVVGLAYFTISEMKNRSSSTKNACSEDGNAKMTNLRQI